MKIFGKYKKWPLWKLQDLDFSSFSSWFDNFSRSAPHLAFSTLKNHQIVLQNVWRELKKNLQNQDHFLQQKMFTVQSVISVTIFVKSRPLVWVSILNWMPFLNDIFMRDHCKYKKKILLTPNKKLTIMM